MHIGQFVFVFLSLCFFSFSFLSSPSNVVVHGRSSSTFNQSQINLRPIVGILTQPTNSSLGSQYIAASYVKFVESSGAQVVPVFYNSTKDQLQQIFKSINGILFPGGGANLNYTTFYETGKFFLESSMNALNQNQDYFPVFGHCLGFELITKILSQNITILNRVDAMNYSIPLNLAKHFPQSRWLGQAPQEIIEIVSQQPVAMNNHVWGLSPEAFEANKYLPDIFNVLSTNFDKEGIEFISTIEANDYPIYAIQWHAEKPLFEWDLHEQINHSPDAIRAMQYFSNFLGSEARKSMHQFPSYDLETKALIYNWNPTYTAPLGSEFDQCYYW